MPFIRGKARVRSQFAASCIAAALILFAQLSVAQQSQESKQPRKTATAKKTTQTKKAEKKIEPADFSALTAFKDALLDLKGAVEVGVNREDYQRKLQAASGERLKAEDRLPDGEHGPVRLCFLEYEIALTIYQKAASKWGVLLLVRQSGTEDEISRAEAELKATWGSADLALDNARTCTGSPKPN